MQVLSTLFHRQATPIGHTGSSKAPLFHVKRAAARTMIAASKVRKRLKMSLYRPLFGDCGRNVYFDPDGFYKYENIRLGNSVYIGPGAHMSGPEIVIGNKVMIGPHVTVIGGDHEYSRVGEYMYDCREGGSKNRVVIEDDVWIGSDVIILKGVTIGEGVVVGAGALVSKSVPPYAVVIGAPARVLKMRFSPEEIKTHKLALKKRAI